MHKVKSNNSFSSSLPGSRGVGLLYRLSSVAFIGLFYRSLFRFFASLWVHKCKSFSSSLPCSRGVVFFVMVSFTGLFDRSLWLVSFIRLFYTSLSYVSVIGVFDKSRSFFKYVTSLFKYVTSLWMHNLKFGMLQDTLHCNTDTATHTSTHKHTHTRQHNTHQMHKVKSFCSLIGLFHRSLFWVSFIGHNTHQMHKAYKRAL